MVGDVDAVGAVLDGIDGILDSGDTLEDDGQIGAAADLVERVPLGESVSGYGEECCGRTVLGRVVAEALRKLSVKIKPSWRNLTY